MSADGTGTLLRFSHRGLGVRKATGFLRGTRAFLDHLEAYLANDELPEWTNRRRQVIESSQPEPN